MAAVCAVEPFTSVSQPANHGPPKVVGLAIRRHVLEFLEIGNHFPRETQV